MLLLDMMFFVGLSFFILLFPIAILYESRKLKIKKRLERLRMYKSDYSFSTVSVLGLEPYVEKVKKSMLKVGREGDYEDIFIWLTLIMVGLFSVAVYLGFTLLAFVAPFFVVMFGKNILDSIANNRTRLLEDQFKDFLATLNLHISVDKAFIPSIIKSSSSVEEPLKQYTDRVVVGLRSGESVEDVLKVFKKIPSLHISAWVDSALFAVRVKADLSAMCRRTSDRLGLKLKLSNKISANTSQSKSLMLSIGAVTVFMGVSTILSSPDFMRFYSSQLGRSAISVVILVVVVTTLYIFRRIDYEMNR